MRPIRIPLNYRLTDEPFDTRVGQLIGYLAGMFIVPVAVVALVRHPGGRADFLLGLGLACPDGIALFDAGDALPPRWRFSGQSCAAVTVARVHQLRRLHGIMITGVLSLAGLGLTPVQVTLGLLLLCSLSLAVLVLGMMTTVVRSLKR